MITRKFTMKINMDNAAFDEDACHEELARILRFIADHDGLAEIVELGGRLPIFDVNGNKCGSALVEIDGD